MKKIFLTYFHFSRLERYGILVLAVLCVGFLIFPKIVNNGSQKATTDFSQFESEITRFENAFTEEKKYTGSEDFKLFHFNPNTVTEQQLNDLGLPDRTIQTFLNFRSKGGKFFKKEDFKKVYGVTPKEYARLENYIQIDSRDKGGGKETQKANEIQEETFELFEFNPNQVSRAELKRLGFPDRVANNLIKFREKGGKIRHRKELAKIYGMKEKFFEEIFPFVILEEDMQEEAPPKQESFVTEKQEPQISKPTSTYTIDVNTATSEDWQKLYGIGPYYTKNILKFREKLGGFHNIDQIAETYNLPDSTFQKIRHQLMLNAPPKQMNLNNVTQEELAAHPYLKYSHAKVIVNYREQHGRFKDLKDLEKIVILNKELIQKIEPYFFVE